MMVAVVLRLYAYCVGVPSSRKIELACWEDAACRVLAGTSSRTTTESLSSGGVTWPPFLSCSFRSLLRLRQKAGLASLDQAALP